MAQERVMPSDTTEELRAALQEGIDRVEQRSCTLQELLDERAKNLSPVYMTEDELSKLDAGIKKNTAMKKKLSTISATTCAAVCRDIGSLNQSKFLAEAATALLQATTKASAIQWVLKAAQEIHRRYATFQEAFSTALGKELECDLDLTDATAVSKRRACMKLALNVEKAALCKALYMIRPAMKQIGRVDMKKRDGTPVAALSLLTSLVRSSQDYLFYVTTDVSKSLPAEIQDLSSLAASEDENVAKRATQLSEAVAQWNSLDSKGAAADATQAAAIVEGVQRIFNDACTALEQWHEDLRTREKKNAKLQLARGAVPASVQQAFDEQKITFAAFKSGLEALAGALGQQLPELQQGITAEDTDTVHIVSTAAFAGSPDGLWDDDHMAYFYTNLPNLTSVVPSMALNNGKEQEGDEAPSGEVDTQPTAGSDEIQAPQSDAGGDADEKESLSGGNDDEEAPASLTEEGQAEPTGMREIHEQLETCTTSERADEIAINFCLIQTKNRRKIISQYLGDLFKVPLQLLPFYARIVATLSQQYRDIGAAVGLMVARKVRGLAKKVDATNKTAEPRVASARYLAELAKFRVVDPGDFFVCLKRCLDDFTGHNIDTACELVVAAGAFMMRQSETHERMESMLGVMMRHRTSRQLDAAKAWNIENAYLACNPRTQAAAPVKRTPLQRYIHKLLFSCVQQQDVKVDKLVRHLRRLPWDQCEREVLKSTCEAAVSGSFDKIQSLASLMAALNKYRPSLVLALVDFLIEEVVSGLQHPSMHTPQASIAYTRLLCELYNFQVIKTSHLFSILYLYITIGHSTQEDADMLDSRDSFVRVRSIFTILQSSGHYFTGGNAHSKLKKYFVFLQRYLLTKEDLPADLQTIFHSLHGQLLAESELYPTYDEADKAAREYLATDDHDQDPKDSGNPQDAAENDAARDNQQPTEQAEASAAAAEDPDTADQAEDDLFEKELASIIPGQVNRHPVKDSPAGETSDSSPVCFRVRLKRQNARGDQTHRLELPSSSTIAAHLNEHRTEEELERSRMKELVLAAEANLTPEQVPLSEHGRKKDQHRRKHGVAQRGPDTAMDEDGLPGVFRNVRGHL